MAPCAARQTRACPSVRPSPPWVSGAGRPNRGHWLPPARLPGTPPGTPPHQEEGTASSTVSLAREPVRPPPQPLVPNTPRVLHVRKLRPGGGLGGLGPHQRPESLCLCPLGVWGSPAHSRPATTQTGVHSEAPGLPAAAPSPKGAAAPGASSAAPRHSDRRWQCDGGSPNTGGNEEFSQAPRLRGRLLTSWRSWVV